MATDFAGRNLWTGSAGSPVMSYNIDSDRRDIDVASDIPQLVPSATPFLTVLMRARKTPVNSLEFMWYDEDEPVWYTQANGDYNDSVTTVTVDDASFIKPKHIIKNTATGEIMRVTGVSGNDLTVDRGYGYDADTTTGTQATAGSSDDYIMLLHTAMEENSDVPETYATQPNKEFNYVQTFRTPFDGSMDNELEAKKAGDSTRVRLRRLKAIEHRIGIERQVTFGERKEDVSNKIRMTGGVLQYIKTNNYNVGSTNNGILTEAEWEAFTEMAFKYGNKDVKLFVTSRKVGSILNQFASDRIVTTSGEDTYGMKLKRIETFHGDIIIATTRLFEHDYEGMGVVLDVENIDYRPYGGYDTKLRANIQPDSLDGWMDEYMTKAGLRVRLEKTHAILSGVTK